MDWVDYALARQLLSEEHIGTRIREARFIEDEQFKASARNSRERHR